jgi:hypothetical protein
MASCISDTGEADHVAFSLPVTRLVELPDTFKAIAAGSHDPENAVRWQRISGPALRTKGAYLHEYGSWLFSASEPTAPVQTFFRQGSRRPSQSFVRDPFPDGHNASSEVSRAVHEHKLSIGPPCFGLRVGLRLSTPNSGSASVYGSHAGNIEADGEGAKEVFCRYDKRCHCGDIERQHDVRRYMPLEWLIVIGQMRLTPRNVLWWDGYYP